LHSYKKDGNNTNPDTISRENLDVFPSVNLTVNLTKSLLFRLAGGKTINRPEFREVSRFSFMSFEENTFIFGNPDLKNCYITNADARLEWYPTSEEIVSIGAFYKNFENPIENHLANSPSGWYYQLANSENAKSYGLELDIRKRLHELENIGAFSFLSNLTFVINASLINSEINVITANNQTTIKRELQFRCLLSGYQIKIYDQYNV
jgi:outer membrane receptor protein involved in Fe transport